jgi:chromosome partitioning protein
MSKKRDLQGSKTTPATNIGAILNKPGKNILLIDLDPQAKLTQRLGIIEPERNIYSALREGYKLQPIEILKGLDVIPSTLDRSVAEVGMSGEAKREYILRELIKPISASYDYILIDNPHTQGVDIFRNAPKSYGDYLSLDKETLKKVNAKLLQL